MDKITGTTIVRFRSIHGESPTYTHSNRTHRLGGLEIVEMRAKDSNIAATVYMRTAADKKSAVRFELPKDPIALAGLESAIRSLRLSAELFTNPPATDMSEPKPNENEVVPLEPEDVPV